MASKKCLICSNAFSGRRDAKTCSARCRKRLQKVRWSFAGNSSGRGGRLAKTLSLIALGLAGLLTLALSLVPNHTSAAAPSNLNFQARLLSSSGNVVADGDYNVEFKIYDSLSSGASSQGACSTNSTGDDCWWLETRTGGDKVRVVNGYLTVNLGSVTAFGASVPWDQQLYLTMNIGGTGSPSWDGEMTPRIKLTALPYAFYANDSAKLGGIAASSYLTSTTGVQLQGSTPGTPQTGNFNISGTGIAGTSLLTPSITTATAGALGIANSTATAVNIGNTSSNITTTVTGLAVFKPSTGNDSTAAFQIQNASGGSLLNIDSTNSNITINGANNGLLQSWQTGTTTGLSARDSYASVIANGFIYILGGADTGGSATSTVQYARINADGSTGSWSTTTSLPGNRADASAAVANGYIYVTGGTTANSNATSTNTVLYAKINQDGTLGTWQQSTNSIIIAGSTTNRHSHASVVVNGYLYVIAGANQAGTTFGTVYYSKLNADGTNGSWAETTASGNVGSRQSVATANGYIYWFGGNSSTILGRYSRVNADGTVGTWTAITSAFPAHRFYATPAIINGYVYIVGGNDNASSNFYANTFYAPLDANGDITTSWSCQGSVGDCGSVTPTNSNALPTTRGWMARTSMVNNGFIYIVDGHNGGGTTATSYYASTARIKVNGSLDLVGATGENLSEGGSGGSLTAGNTDIIGNLGVRGQANFLQGVSVDKSLTVFGDAAVKTITNTTTAFQVQNSSGAQLLNIDTTNAVADLTTNGNNNLITNGSIEPGTTGWAIDGASVTIAQDTAYRYIGNASLSITTPATADRGAKFNLTTTTLASNTKYNFTVSARLGTGSSISNMSTFAIGRAEDGSTETSCLTGQTINNSGWATFNCSFTTGTTSGTPYVYVKQTDATARTFYIDAVQLTRYSLLTNHSIESAISGNWTALGTTPTTHARVTTQFYDSTASLQITTQATANQGTKQSITLADNTRYTLSFYAYSSGTSITTMAAGYASDGSTETDCMSGQTIPGTGGTAIGGWTQFTCRFTTPGSHSGTPYIYIKNSGATVRTWFVDEVRLTLGNPLGAYQEGQISLNGVIVSPTTFQGQFDSTSAFQVQNSSGANLLQIDTINSNLTINGANNGNLQPWKTNSNSLPAARSRHATVYANGYVYAIGGFINADATQTKSTVMYAKVNADGSIGSWSCQGASGTGAADSCGTTPSNSNTLPSGRKDLTAAFANGYLYAIGGLNNAGTAQSTIYYARVNTDGSTGTWQTSTSMPLLRFRHSTVVNNGYLYVIQGQDASSTRATVAYGKLNADGSVGPWFCQVASGTACDPSPVVNTNGVLGGNAQNRGITTANGYIYLVGGDNGSQSSNVHYARMNADGSTGAWTATTSLPEVATGSNVYALNGYIYAAGGDGEAMTYSARLNSDGTIGAWRAQPDLPSSVVGNTGFNGVTVNGYLYVVGGLSNVTPSTAVYYTSSARTQIAGSLDLVGVSGQDLLDAGSQAGSLTAGNTNVLGNLQVQGQASFNQGVSVRDALNIKGTFVLQNSANSNSAFQIQNANNVSLVNVSTVSNTQNLITNPSFESNTNGWAVVGGSTLTTTASAYQSGTQSLSVAAAATNPSGTSYTYAFKANTTYTLSFYAAVNSGSMSVFEYGYTVNGSSTNCATGQTLTTTLTRFTCTFTTASTTTAGDLFYLRKTGVSTPTIYIDAVQLEVAGSASVFADQAYPNLVANPDIETSTNGWSAKGTGTISLTDEFSAFGGRSLKIVTGAAANNGASYAYPFKASSRYTLSFWARKDTSSSTAFAAGVAENGSDSNCTTYPDITSVGLTTTWTLFTCVFTTGSTIGSSSNFYIKQSDTSTDNIYIDGVSLVAGGAAQNYIRGGENLQVDPLYSNLVLNQNNNGELQPWSAGNLLTAARFGGKSVAVNGYIYYIGGQSGGTEQSTVYSAKLNADGSTGSWSANTSLPDTRAYAGVTTANGYIYVISGQDGTPSDTLRNTVLYAKVGNDGTIGTWKCQGADSTECGTTPTSTSNLPSAALGSPQSFVANGYIYLVGGTTSTSGTPVVTTVQYAKLNADGSTGSWSTTTALPYGLIQLGLTVANNYVYVVGGIGTTDVHKSTLYAALNTNGTIGSWSCQGTSATDSCDTATITNANEFPESRRGPTVVAQNGYIYVMGGRTSAAGSSRSTVFYAKLNSNGSTGSYSTAANSLPGPSLDAASTSVNGYIYYLGGDTNAGSTATDTVYYTSTSRIKVAGSLDLVGISGTDYLDNGSQAGSLIAGNTDVLGNLSVRGSAQIQQGLTVGDTLTVASNSNSSAAFAVQNASSVNILKVDSSTGNILQYTSTTTYLGGGDGSGGSNSGTGGGDFNSTVMVDNFAYIVKNGDGGTCNANTTQAQGCEFQVWDYSNSASPSMIGGADTAGLAAGAGGGGTTNTLDLAISGRYAYIVKAGSATTCSQTAGSANGCELVVFDISNPDAPVFVGGGDSDGTTNGGSGSDGFLQVAISGRYAYITKAASATACTSAIGCELQVWDIGNPYKPTYVGGADASGTANTGTSNSTGFDGLTAYGNFVYVGKSALVDATACSSSTGANAQRCEVLAFDVSTPSSPTYTYGIDSSGTVGGGTSDDTVRELTVSGGYLYVAKSSSGNNCSSAAGCEVQIYRIANTNSTVPSYVGGIDASGTTNGGTTGVNINDIEVSGKYAYLAFSGNATACSQTAGSAAGCEFKVVDVSTPSTPTYVAGNDVSGSTTGTGNNTLNGVAVAGRTAVVAQQSNTGTNCSAITGCEVKFFDVTGFEASNITTGSLKASNIQVQDVTATGDVSLGGTLNVGKSTQISGNLAVGGSVLLQNTSNSSTAFQVQNTNGTTFIGVDTTYSSSNLITNGSIELDTTGWAAKGAVTNFGRSTSQKYQGNASLTFTSDTSGNDGAKYNITLTNSTQYTASMCVMNTTSNTASFQFGYAFDGSTETTYNSGNVNTYTTGWGCYSLTFTPTGITGTPYFFAKTTSGTSGRVFYIDAISIIATSGSNGIVPAYQEGSIKLDGVIKTALQLQNATNATSAFLVNAANGDRVFTVDTVNERVGVNTHSPNANLDVNGSSLVRYTGTDAYQIQDGTSSYTLFTGDTTNKRIIVGSGSTGTTTPSILVLDNKSSSGDPTGVNGAMYYNANSHSFRCYLDGEWQNCGGLISANTSVPAGNTVANTGAGVYTDFSSSYTLPANYCQPGRVIRLSASGVYSTTGTPSLGFRVRLGSTNLSTTITTIPTQNNAANRQWNVRYNITCDTAGASGTVEGQGMANVFTGAAANTDVEMVNTATITIDTTTTQAITLAPVWSAASASNTITLRQLIIEGMGP